MVSSLTDFYGNLSDQRAKSVNDALTNQEWVDEMKAEIDSLHDNSAWNLYSYQKVESL